MPDEEYIKFSQFCEYQNWPDYCKYDDNSASPDDTYCRSTEPPECMYFKKGCLTTYKNLIKKYGSYCKEANEIFDDLEKYIESCAIKPQGIIFIYYKDSWIF